MHTFSKLLLSFLALVLLFLLAVHPGMATERKAVVFYQANVAKAGELAYLRDSLRLMLASRLASATGAEVHLEKKMIPKRDRNLYRVKSRLVSTSRGMELFVEAFKPGSDEPVSFKAMAGSGAALMTAVDTLVIEMEKSLLNNSAVSENALEATPDVDGGLDLTTAHPDRVFKINKGFGLDIEQDDFIAQKAMEVRTNERYKSGVLPVRSKGMTAGDIDDDGYDEIVIASNTKVYIYQLKNQKIQLLDTVSLPGGIKVHSLNAADLNNNGIMELYISSTRNDNPRSFVLEWSPATGTKWLYKNVPWYLRPISLPENKMLLAGQEGGINGGTQPGIHRIHIGDNGKVSSEELLVLPETVDLFNFVFADLDGDTVAEVVTLDDRDKLRVFSSTLELLYTSPAGFGGRELSEGVTAPIRIAVTDFENDGRQDIIVVDNELYTPEIMKKTKWYKNGQVRGLLWDMDTFVEMWSTSLFPRSIIDFQFLSSKENLDSEKNPAGRLFIVEPEKADLLESFVFGRGGNRLSVYGLEFISKRH